MALDLEEIIRVRPFLYHLTDRRNLDRILRTGVLEPPAILAKKAGREGLITARRAEPVEIMVDSELVILRDQAPLHAGNMKLTSGWTFERFVRTLNARIFFWPGSAGGPIEYGMRHFKRYEAEKPCILRIRLASLVKANPRVVLEVCRYNSGSPRWSRGVASPRGPQTFVRIAKASFAASQIVEITARGTIQIPSVVEVGLAPSGPWRRRRRK